jgi:tetratricopeptide (TPR) repeat protein
MDELLRATARGLWMVLVTALALGAAQAARAQAQPLSREEVECGAMTAPNRVSPMDYRTDRKMLSIVEFGHFQPQVENLVKPMFDAFGSDLDYTLYAYPNHHRALVTLVRLGEREKSLQPRGAGHSIDCYFRRAIRFAPDDLIVRDIYSTFLAKNGRMPDAIAQLDFVAAQAGNDAEGAFTHYNVGLLYFEFKQYDKAQAQALRAAELGFERTDLQDRLRKAGQWRDPAPKAASAPTAASEAASIPVEAGAK